MRHVFVEVDVEPLDRPRADAVVVLINVENAVPVVAAVFFVVLDALDLVLVIVWLSLHLVRQVRVHDPEFRVVVFPSLLCIQGLGVVLHHGAQSILALAYCAVAIWLIWIAPRTKAPVLAIKKLVCKSLHERATLV